MGAFMNGFIGIAVLATFAYLYAVLMFVSDYDPNKCEMTYMFEYPQFVRISNVADKRYKKYGLYAYSEGRLTQKARNMHFDGIPVLFIPGNAGSYKQVRSLASVALRKSINSRPGFHFDYFTIDTNEELSGFNGVLLNDQLTYANYSIYHILALYRNNQGFKPKSVIIIGHSMGGIIAKGLLASLPINSDLIPLVIALASPHRRLPVFFDIYSYNFYRNIEKYDADKLTNTVNVFGGFGDFMVTPNLVKGSGINAVTTNVPKTWLPTDHLCILWCKQLVLVLNRALFESIDTQTKQISTDYQYVEAVFQNHLVKNSGTKSSLQHRYTTSTNIDDRGEWIEYLQRQYVVNLFEGTKEPKWYMIRLVKHALHEKLTVLAVNLEVTDWVFACPAAYVKGQGRSCHNGIHLSHLSEIAPTVRHKRRVINLNLHELLYENPTFSHVVIRTLPTSEPISLFVDVYDTNQRKIDANLPNRWSFASEVIVKETIEKAIYYELHFPKLTHVTQAFLLYINPTKCSSDTYHVTATVVLPWSNDQYHHHFTEIDNKPMPLRLFTSKLINVQNATAYVKLTLDPACQYTISVNSDIPKSMAQFARFYSPYLFTYVSTVVLLSFVFQLKSLDEKQRCPLLLSCLRFGARPYYLLPAVKIFSQILGAPVLRKYIPLPDWFYIQEEGLDFFFLPIMLYFVSVGVVWILSVLLMISLFFFETTIHKLALKVLSKAIRSPSSWSDWILGGFQKFPVFVAGALVVMSTTTCGGLALCLGCIFYFLKLTQMSQDVIENIVRKLIKSLPVFLKRLFVKRSAPIRYLVSLDDELDEQNAKKPDLKIDESTKEDLEDDDSSDDEEVDKVRIQNESLYAIIDGSVSKKKSDEKTELEDDDDETNENKYKTDASVTKVRIQNEALHAIVDTSLIKPKDDDSSESDSESEDAFCKIDKHDGDESNEPEQLLQAPNDSENCNKKGSPVPEKNTLSDDKDLLSVLVENLLENNELFFHFTMFCLWFLVTCINIPAVLTWAHNFKFSPKLVVDPSFIPGLIMCVCAVPLWQFDYPKIKRTGYVPLSYVIYVLAVFALMYGTFSLFVLNYVLCAVVAIVVTHQMFAPNRALQVTTDGTENTEDGFKKFKSKME